MFWDRIHNNDNAYIEVTMQLHEKLLPLLLSLSIT